MSRGVQAVVREIQRARRFLVTSHPSPDGDAIGSTVAMTLALEALGREVYPYNPDPVPRRYRFLRGAAAITQTLPSLAFDATLILDCSDSRMFKPGDLPPAQMGTVVVIDHHRTEGDIGEVIYRDPKAAAVGVLLFKLFKALKLTLTQEIAEALFCSLMSDTGSFRYQNTNAEAMKTSATLLDHGVDPWRVASHLYEDRPQKELELLGRVLQSLEVSINGRTATLTVTEQMLAATGCTPEMTDGLINYARGIRGVEVALLLRPGPGGVRISFRSRGNIDVSEIAARFGGGGHKNAAGCVIDEQLPRVRELLFTAVESSLTR